MLAVIFTSAADREISHLAADRIESFGIETRIAVDLREGVAPTGRREIGTAFNRLRHLLGAECAAGIAATLWEHSSGHDVVAKIDADVALLAPGATWLAAAVEHAHGYRIGRNLWGGIWAAPRSLMSYAARRIPPATRHCRACPENAIFFSFFKSTIGLRRAPADAAVIWHPALTPPPQPAHFLTLPSGLLHPVRGARAKAMHAAFF